MNSSLVSDGQSLLDVALQEHGTLAALFDLADANGLAITDQLTPGVVLEVPESEDGRPEVVRYFVGKFIRINTNDYPILIAIPPGGFEQEPDFDFEDFDNQDFDA